MKKLSWFGRIALVTNVLFALFTLFVYLLQNFYIKGLVVLTFLTPLLLVIHTFFLAFWILKRNGNAIISLLILALAYNQLTNSFGWKTEKEEVEKTSDISLMTYNVRALNKQGWIEEDSVDYKIIKHIKEETPDIIAIQEFSKPKEKLFNYFPYKYTRYSDKWNIYGQAIFSKYEMINNGSLDFQNTANNAIFADIIIGVDTLRVYSLHLQSFYIQPEKEELSADNSDRLLRRMIRAIDVQKKQVKTVTNHMAKSPYKIILAGDLNTTQYTYIYKQLANGMKDSFREGGSGFGRTFYFRYFPLRIDHILVDPTIEVRTHKNYDKLYSDHFPAMAVLSLSFDK